MAKGKFKAKKLDPKLNGKRKEFCETCKKYFMYYPLRPLASISLCAVCEYVNIRGQNNDKMD